MHSKHSRLHILIILAYLVVALALTWPLVLQFDTHVPGNGVDDPPLTWNLWWVKHALLDLGSNPFQSTYLFYPLGINLAFYTLTVLNGLLSIPLQAIWGLVPASNVLLLSSFVLSGYGAFLLALYVLNRERERKFADGEPWSWSVTAAAFCAGMLYAFASVKLAYAALGQWNIASSQWIPFYVLYLFKTGESPRRWCYPLMAALFLLLQTYAEMTYSTFLVLFTLLWLGWRLVALARPVRVGQLGLTARALVVMGALVAIGLVPILAMMIPDILAEGDIFVAGGGFADVFSADLLGFWVPMMYHPFLGDLVQRFDFDYSVGQHLYLGYSVLALVLVGVIARLRRSSAGTDSWRSQQTGGRLSMLVFWMVSAVSFWLLTLGPRLRINGQQTAIPLPFSIVAELPFFKGNRYPSRYGVMLFLSLAILVALGMASLLQMRSRGRRLLASVIPGLLVALMLFEHLSIPLPLTDMMIPAMYYSIAADTPANSTLLDLPVAWRNGFRVTGTQHPLIMFEQYYQSAHGRPILAGNTSRNPDLKFQYFTEAPVINTIIALETGHEVVPEVIAEDKLLAPSVLRFFNVAAIVVHPEQTGPELSPYLEETMPIRRWLEDGEAIAYQVDLPPWPDQWTIEPGQSLARLSLADGWGAPGETGIWAQRKATRLLVPMNGEQQQLTFRAYAPGRGQQLEIAPNGHVVTEIDLVAGWMDYDVELDAPYVQEGLNELWFRFSTLYPTELASLSPRTIGATGVDSPVNLVVQSAGEEVGDFAHIFVDGRDVSLNERGYNVVVLDALTGDVDRVAVFDTHLDLAASEAMAQFLEGLAPGNVVAVAVADEASNSLSDRAVEALHGIGATGDLRDRFRWGHAIIGVRGASPGTALESMAWMRPVMVMAGEGSTEPFLAALFETLRFESIARH